MNQRTNEIIFDTDTYLTRPIQMIDDVGYFATQVSTRDADGNVTLVWVVADETLQHRFAQSPLDDHEPMETAPFVFVLPSNARPGSTLSSKAYKDHVLDGNPFRSVSGTFRKSVEAIDHFMSFDGSFASQSDMSELLACWVFSTYATTIFETVGYPWPNGERGSGKSQCLKTLMDLAFMGQTITSSSSFASVRDEAALGATLGFDDFENIARMEDNKRQLLLAGNTKGAGFICKESKSTNTWANKYIDCFAPRAFTSIAIPDDVLASRTILIPLARSQDKAKTRNKPMNPKHWPTPAGAIRDQIWLNVATRLAEIASFKAEVDEASDYAGRDFDIFQAPLTMAYWLENHGAEGLFGRMLSVMEAYHSTKQKNLLPSFEAAVLQAVSDKLSDSGLSFKSIATSEIATAYLSALRRWDITDDSLTSADVQKIGMLLSRLGFKRSFAHGSSRRWDVSLDQLERVAKAAGVTLEIIAPKRPAQATTIEGWESVALSKGIGDDNDHIPWE